MLHKTKHGACLELVGRPTSWCKPAVASVQWSTTRLCEWKALRSLFRAALPLHKGWKLLWVSFSRQFSKAGLGSGPSSGGAWGRWVRSLLTLRRGKRIREEFIGTPFFLASVLPVIRPSAVGCWSSKESEVCRTKWIRAGYCTKRD